MKILIVEDEAMIAESLFQLLTILEYEPMEPVATPDEAISIIKTTPPDLAILDITLQNNRFGLEVADYINTNKLRIPFIILTAHSDAATIARVKQYKPAAYLVKPFLRDSLFAAIEMAAPDNDPEEDSQRQPDVHVDDDTRFIKIGTKHEKINLQEILMLQAKGKYIEIHFTNSKRLVRYSLSSFISSFTAVNWLRTHKTYAVNPEFIVSFSADELLVGNKKVPVGRFFQPQVQAFLTSKSV